MSQASSSDDATAFVFPGQGPQSEAMLSAFRDAPFYRAHLAEVEAVLGVDPEELARQSGAEGLRRNDVASVLTSFISAVVLDELARRGVKPAFAAGYSVGQWSAMYAAGMMSFSDLVAIVKARAEAMTASKAGSRGAMLAVIGLPNALVEEVCANLSTPNAPLCVSNYNCVGQVTLAGTTEAIARASDEFAKRKARKIVPVATSGAWHSPLLAEAAAPLAELLARQSFSPPRIPVADNVSGKLLPAEPAELRRQLVLHLTEPVRWDSCVRTLVALGARRFVEAGHGDMLTKFGFFIDRSVSHVSGATLLESGGA